MILQMLRNLFELRLEIQITRYDIPTTIAIIIEFSTEVVEGFMHDNADFSFSRIVFRKLSSTFVHTKVLLNAISRLGACRDPLTAIRLSAVLAPHRYVDNGSSYLFGRQSWWYDVSSFGVSVGGSILGKKGAFSRQNRFSAMGQLTHCLVVHIESFHVGLTPFRAIAWQVCGTLRSAEE